MPGCRADVYKDGGYKGWHVSFGPGDYNKKALEAMGGKDNDASSIKVTGSPESKQEGKLSLPEGKHR